jgi:GT2 family glycosyltransferase
MKIAILALTCGRYDQTVQSWNANLSNCEHDIYHWDNTPFGREYQLINDFVDTFEPVASFADGNNWGISVPLNNMMHEAFRNGADMVITMANDIIEPDGWIEKRIEAVETIPNVAVVAIPPAGRGTVRYPKKALHGIKYEDDGDVIGNYGITKECYNEIGGFHAGYGIYGPIDLDYCFRIRLVGKKAIYLSDESAIHIGVDNPYEYQKAKDESLRASWAIFADQKRKYSKGIDLKQ